MAAPTAPVAMSHSGPPRKALHRERPAGAGWGRRGGAPRGRRRRRNSARDGIREPLQAGFAAGADRVDPVPATEQHLEASARVDLLDP